MKAINKTMTHGEIYSYAIGLVNNPTDDKMYMPGALAFGIQKNKAVLTALAEEIEKGRLNIIQHYSTGEEEGSFSIPAESIEAANKELNDLLSITEDVKLYQCSLEELGDIQFTAAQMQALMFMITDGEDAE